MVEKDDKDFAPTQKELKQISEAFKKEEFRKLFFEYAEELADPVKRKQYEDELNQMEMERNPESKGLNFLHQEPNHFIEILDSNTFINITTSEKIGKPEMKQMKSPEGKLGFGFEIPCSVSPSVRELGKKRKVVDVCFSPDTLRMGETNKEFMKKNIRETAIDQVNHFHKLGLKKKFTLGKTGKSMGQVDMNIKISGGDGDKENIKSETENEDKTAHIDHLKSKLGEFKRNKAKYRIKQQYKSGLSNNSASFPPENLLIEIDLPDIADKKMITSDVELKTILLEFEQHYENLRISLPNEIDIQKTRVKWFKNKRQLVFTCPVKNDSILLEKRSEFFDDNGQQNSKHSGISEVTEKDLEEIQKINLRKAFKEQQEKEKLSVENSKREPKVKFQDESDAQIGELEKFENFTAVEDRLYLTITVKGQDLPRDWKNIQNMFFSEKKQNYCFSVNISFNESTKLDFTTAILNIRVSSPSKDFIVVQFRKTDVASQAGKTCIKTVTLENEAFSKTVTLFDEDEVKEIKNLPKIDYSKMFQGGIEEEAKELDARIDSLEDIKNEIKEMEELGGKKYLQKKENEKKEKIKKTEATVIQNNRGKIAKEESNANKTVDPPKPVEDSNTIDPPKTEKIKLTNDLLDDLD